MTIQKKILIAEDSNIVLNVVSKVLENMNYKVLGVKNGKELLSKMEKENFDLILMDINMPKMDGITCAKHIRDHNDKRIKNIPIIALSGNDKNLSVEEYQAIGINDLIQKPIDFDQMAQKISSTLN
ncbi:response regulator [Hyphobacterium sp. CCMP332]|nr:response regulator [Hyphobacterium sp. CCMP332]